MKKSHLNWKLLIFFSICFAFLGLDKWYIGKKNIAMIKGLMISVFGFFGIFFLIILSTPNLGVLNSTNFPSVIYGICIFIVIIYIGTLLWYIYDIIFVLFGKTRDKNKQIIQK